MRHNRAVRLLILICLFLGGLAHADSECREQIALLPFRVPKSLVSSLLDDSVYFHKPRSDEDRVLAYLPLYFSGGKRLRPLMVYLSALVLGHETKTVEPLAFIVEGIHLGSLALDDTIDEAETRRGGPVLYREEGFASGVVSGPWMQSYVQDYAEDVTGSAVRRRLNQVTQSMGTGEIFQEKLKTRVETTRIYSQQEYFRVAQGKTGALFGFSTQIVPLHFGLDKAQSDAWKQLGELMGITYQMRDDFQDAHEEPLEINYALLRWAERTNGPAFVQLTKQNVAAVLALEQQAFSDRRARMHALIDEIALTGAVGTPDHRAAIATLRDMVDFICKI